MTDPSAIRIEEGTLADLAAVMRVMESSFDPSFGEAWTDRQCAGLLPMPGVWLTLARQDENVIGFAMGRRIGQEAELLLLAVKKDVQRRGIGQMLLQHFVAEASAKGADHLHLEVREGNHALDLYKRCGFSEVGRRKSYYSGRDGQLYDALTLATGAMG